jgi:hypothetical protein
MSLGSLRDLVEVRREPITAASGEHFRGEEFAPSVEAVEGFALNFRSTGDLGNKLGNCAGPELVEMFRPALQAQGIVELASGESGR